MDKDTAPRPYSGPHVFINSTADGISRSRDETFAISSHVSKTHRKWLKAERLKRLNASAAAGKAVAQRAIATGAPMAQTVEPDPNAFASLYHALASSTSADASGRRPRPYTHGQARAPIPGVVAAEAASSHEMVRYSGGFMGSQHVYSFGGSQDVENDDREGRRACEQQCRWATGQPGLSLRMWKGNSDPFQCAAVHLAAQDHEMFRQAQRFPVFAAWPDKASAVFRAPIADTANSHIELQQVMSDEGQVHAILASGYHVTARSPGMRSKSEVYVGRELAHKTRAVALLRQKLLKHGFSEAVATLIRLLISLDFEAGDFIASLVHLRGLWSMSSSSSSSVPGSLHVLDTQELLIVSDVWVGLSLLKKPEIPPSRYDPGGRPLQTFDAALRHLESEAITSPCHCYEVEAEPEPETSRRSETVLDAATFALLDAASEVVNTKAIMDKIEDATLQQEVVWWMHRRATATSGLLMSGYVDAISFCGDSCAPPPAKLDVRKAMIAAACLSGVLFMNMRFMDSPNNYDFSKTFRMIEPMLQSISEHSRECGQQEQDESETFLWLLFMCAMGSDVYAGRGDIPYSAWPAREFRRVCGRRNVTSGASVVAILGQFQYYPQMDEFIAVLLSDAVELLDKPIIPWSKWCGILDHYVP